MRLLVCVGLLSVSLPGAVRPGHGQTTAKDAPRLVTDRPTRTASASIVRAGRLQIEAGAALVRSTVDAFVPGTGAVRVDLNDFSVGSTLLRIGVLERLEARLGFSGLLRSGLEGTPAEWGAGDVDLGVKFQVSPGERHIPQAALIGSVILPTGEEGFGVDGVSPVVRVAIAHEISPRLSFGWNVGAAFIRTDRGTRIETDTDILYTAALGFAATERVGLFLEGFGTLSGEDQLSDRHLLDGGVTCLVRPNVQLDARAGVGLSDAAEDWFVGAGVSVRVPR